MKEIPESKHPRPIFAFLFKNEKQSARSENALGIRIVGSSFLVLFDNLVARCRISPLQSSSPLDVDGCLVCASSLDGGTATPDCRINISHVTLDDCLGMESIHNDEATLVEQ
jgi:hypothetical protein